MTVSDFVEESQTLRVIYPDVAGQSVKYNELRDKHLNVFISAIVCTILIGAALFALMVATKFSEPLHLLTAVAIAGSVTAVCFIAVYMRAKSIIDFGDTWFSVDKNFLCVHDNDNNIVGRHSISEVKKVYLEEEFGACNVVITVGNGSKKYVCRRVRNNDAKDFLHHLGNIM